ETSPHRPSSPNTTGATSSRRKHYSIAFAPTRPASPTAACGATTSWHARPAGTPWPRRGGPCAPTPSDTSTCRARTAATTHAARPRSSTPPAQGAHDDGQTRLIRDRVPVVAVPIPRRAVGPERTHHRTRAQSPVGTKARTHQERE